MRRPMLESIEGLRPISRNLSLDLVAAIGYGVSGALVSSLLPTIARRGGLEPLGLAALSAAPFLTNLLSVFAGRLGPQSPRQFALLRGIGAGSLVALMLVPGALVIVGVAFVFWISISFSSPFQLRLWGATYPGRIRGRVGGFLGTGRAAAAAVAPFFMSALVQFGIVSLTVGLLLCATASALGVILFWWAARRARSEVGAGPA